MKSIFCGLLLLCICVYGVAMGCRTLMHSYKSMKTGAFIDTKQIARKLLLSDGIVLISTWVLTLLSCADWSVSSILASFRSAVRMTAGLIALSAICIFQVRRYHQRIS